MFSNLKSQVTTKFQSARGNVAGRANQAKKLPAKQPTTVPPSQTMRQAAPERDKSKNQTDSKSTRSMASSTADSVQKLKHSETISSKMRRSAATLPRQTQPLSRRIYRPTKSNIFDYHLSKEETHYFNHFRNPMKAVPAEELQLLKTGQRTTYLETRYAHTPDVKYNYPEATSWRYGWFHRSGDAK